MNITLETLRAVLRDALGQNSFIAAFVHRIEADDTCETASISRDGVLRYNPGFAKRYITCSQDLFCLLLHEVLHPVFGHFVYRGGRLENLAADMVINASISLLFPEPSGRGSLFRKFYEPGGMQGLLRPGSRMLDSRYANLYAMFYAGGRGELSTGEAIQALRILAPKDETNGLSLLGSHGENGEPGGLERLPSEDLSRIAHELGRAAHKPDPLREGYAQELHAFFIETLKSRQCLRRGLLERFATQRKVDRFKQRINTPVRTVSPIPLCPSKRDLVLLSADIIPFQYHNHARRVSAREHGLAIYLDVSGSVNDYLPRIVGILRGLGRELMTIFLFSNQVVETPMKALLKGRVETTWGTDFNCVAASMLEKGFDKAVILTDGYAILSPESEARLKERKPQLLTILFGGKADCPEFAAFGDVVQLEEIID